MGRRNIGISDFKILFIIVVCGAIGIILTIMLDPAVTNDIITMSEDKLKQFSTIIILMSLTLGTIIGVASS